MLSSTLEGMTREEAKEKIEASGGKVTGSVQQEDGLCCRRDGGGFEAGEGAGAWFEGAG